MNTMPILSSLGSTEIILVLLFSGIPLALIIYCIVDIIRNEFRDGNSKLLFFILVILMPCLGSILYLILRNNYIKPKDNFNQFP